MLSTMFGPAWPRKKVTFHSPVATEVSPELQYSSDNNSDTASTCAVVGTSNTLKNSASARSKAKNKGKEKMTTIDDSSDAAPEWTREEDRTICIRKSEAKSFVYNILYLLSFRKVLARSATDRTYHTRWAEIGKELKRGRRECQQRHRALSSHAKELGITTTKLAKLYIEEGNGGGNGDDSKSKKSSKDRNEGKTKNSNKTAEKSKAKHGGKSKDISNYDFKPEASPKSKKKKYKKRAPDSDSSSDSSSDEDEDDDDDPEVEYWAQRRYIYDTLYGGMYPDQKVLRPDRFYSESDCRVLAGLEARYRANKWLHIQADFCNATGRMVEAEVLKAKFYEDQKYGSFGSRA
ncbi:hypothetical protein F4680DRAFT_182373 [Xylaria scruposa]|nr:hypothetical protein F4680DRAFT_182373 [Xylaria scruposa]